MAATKARIGNVSFCQPQPHICSVCRHGDGYGVPINGQLKYSVKIYPIYPQLARIK